jgi:glutamate racemase
MILFFDSGIGGLSYLDRYLELRSEAAVAYLADTAFFPYGERPPSVVRDRVVSLIKHASTVYPIDAIVIACNTASVVALEAVRRTTGVPVVGVVPAVKPAASATKTNHIAVLSTSATARDPYTDDLVERFAGVCEVSRIGLPRLVTAAEESVCSNPNPSVRAIIREDIVPYLGDRVDTVVLACTHFIRLRNVIEEELGRGIRVVDSLEGVVNRLQWIIESKGIDEKRGDTPGERRVLLTSGDIPRSFRCIEMSHRRLDVTVEGVS